MQLIMQLIELPSSYPSSFWVLRVLPFKCSSYCCSLKKKKEKVALHSERVSCNVASQPHQQPFTNIFFFVLYIITVIRVKVQMHLS